MPGFIIDRNTNKAIKIQLIPIKFGLNIIEPHRWCDMASVLISSAVDRGFEPRSGQIKNYKIGITR